MIYKKILAMVIAVAMVMSAMVIINEMTNMRIGFVEEPVSAWITPGIHSREGNGSLLVGSNVLNTSTGSLYYMSSISQIQVNGNLNWGGTTYYLYYPIYTGQYGGDSYALTWAKYMGKAGTGSYPPEITPPSDDSFGAGGNEKDVELNCSGLWLIDDDTTHDVSTKAQMTSTIPAWFWVNTSNDFTLTASDTNFRYGDAGSVTFNVTQTTGGTTPTALLAVHNTTGKLVGTWNDNQPFTNGIKTINKNSSVFTNAGTWYAIAYYDLDGGTGIAGSHVTYLDAPGGAGYDWYNNSLYGNDTTVIETQAATYSYEFGGPWDPPEYNSTAVTITVNTGQPTIILTNATPVYWGFDLRMDINVTDANGNGITQGWIKLRKSTGTALYYCGNRSGTVYDMVKWWINETGTTYGNSQGLDGEYSFEIPRADPEEGTNWSELSNGTWKVFFILDSNGDGVEEFNNSKSFSVTSRTRDVDLIITNDGYSATGTATDNKIDVPDRTSGGPAGAGPADTLSIDFKLYGRAVTGRRAYYGDDTTGDHPEDCHNITVTGDILYQPVCPAAGLVGSATNLITNNGDGTWTLAVTPTKPGGSITIAFNWPGANNGSDSETLSIINGTHVSTNIPSFSFGENVYLTVTVKSQQNIVENNARVYVFWEGGGLINDSVNSSWMTPATNGEYTFWIKPSEQGTNAPRNITIAAKTAGTTFWGYTTVKMLKSHNMVVNATPTTSYAGDPTTYDIDILVDGAAPETYSDITVALYKMDGTIVTGDDAWSSTGSYDLNDQEIPLSGGMYQLYAYNNTHDSEGNNATITVTKYTVTSNPSVLAWLIDTSQNMSFEVNSPITNGTLTINNMSSTPNASDLGNSHDVIIANGLGTLTEVNATTLGNLTFAYIPDGGYSRPANGLVQVTTATATPTPAVIYVGETTNVEIHLTHPATGANVAGVYVGIDLGMNLSDSILAKIPAQKKTGTDGKLTFGIKAEATGNATIYVKSGTDPNNPQVIQAMVRKTMKITTAPSVTEGGTFTVKAKDVNNNLITDATVSVVFNGVTYTTTTGETEPITSPSVAESLDYLIEATATGYTSDDTTIKVLNVPALQISTNIEVKAGVKYDVAVSNQDTGIGVVGAIITVTTPGGETTTYTTKAGGIVQLTAPCTTGEYKITATFGTFKDAEFTVTVTGTCEEEDEPGFELLTLIAAIGVALILLRRRRRK